MLLFIAVAGFYRLEETVVPGEPEIKILVDNSTSMSLFNAGMGAQIKEGIDSKNSGIPVRIIPASSGDTSAIGDDILNNIHGNDNILIVTDGNVNYGRSIGDIISGQEIKITYKAKVLSSVFQGSSYKNFATCKGTIGSEEREESLETIECNVANSSVVIGTGIGYGGNLLGQVLGASIELPDTGSDTLWIIMALTMLGIGMYINRKYAKK